MKSFIQLDGEGLVKMRQHETVETATETVDLVAKCQLMNSNSSYWVHLQYIVRRSTYKTYSAFLKKTQLCVICKTCFGFIQLKMVFGKTEACFTDYTESCFL